MNLDSSAKRDVYVFMPATLSLGKKLYANSIDSILLSLHVKPSLISRIKPYRNSGKDLNFTCI
jgi:hypothetical protein